MSKHVHTPLNRTSLVALIAFSALFAALVVGCGKDGGGDYEGNPPPDYAKLLADSPPELAAIHEEADELLDGGKDAYEKRIEELNGYPIVANVWASWCVPCRAEFPHFQEASADLGREVAFLGINSEDSADAAATFLESSPLSYPSYSDQDRNIADELNVRGYPATAFYDAEGELTYLSPRPYTSTEELEEDIERFAVRGESP